MLKKARQSLQLLRIFSAASGQRELKSVVGKLRRVALWLQIRRDKRLNLTVRPLHCEKRLWTHVVIMQIDAVLFRERLFELDDIRNIKH